MKLSPIAEEYFKELEKLPLISKETFDKLWKLSKKGDKKAKQKLIESHLRYVLPVAKKYYRPGVDLLDLIEEGNLGLMHAIEKYNPKKKSLFSTYANYWIKQYIKRSVEEHSKTIRIPTHTWENLRKWIKNWETLHSQLGRYPTISEMAQKLHLSVKQIKNIVDTVELFQGISSLETPIDENGELLIKDIITDKNSKTPEAIITTLKLHDELDKALSKLGNRERKILQLRYGLKEKKRTLEEIGKLLKLSRERVRQLEKRGLYQLKWIAHKMKLI